MRTTVHTFRVTWSTNTMRNKEAIVQIHGGTAKDAKKAARQMCNTGDVISETIHVTLECSERCRIPAGPDIKLEGYTYPYAAWRTEHTSKQLA